MSGNPIFSELQIEKLRVTSNISAKEALLESKKVQKHSITASRRACRIVKRFAAVEAVLLSAVAFTEWAAFYDLWVVIIHSAFLFSIQWSLICSNVGIQAKRATSNIKTHLLKNDFSAQLKAANEKEPFILFLRDFIGTSRRRTEGTTKIPMGITIDYIWDDFEFGNLKLPTVTFKDVGNSFSTSSANLLEISAVGHRDWFTIFESLAERAELIILGHCRVYKSSQLEIDHILNSGLAEKCIFIGRQDLYGELGLSEPVIFVEGGGYSRMLGSTVFLERIYKKINDRVQ